MPTPWLPRLSLAIAGLILAALCLGGFYYWKARDYYDRHTRRIGTPIYVPDAELGFQLAPNLSVPLRLGNIYTDARGARVGQAGAPPAATTDLLLAGCSFTFGLNLPHDLTFGAQLEKKFGLRAVNTAVSGYGTRSARLRAERFLDLHPRTVIYGFIEEHLNRNVNPCAPAVMPFCRPLPHHALGGGTEIRKVSFWHQHGEEIELHHPFSVRDVYWAFVRDWASIPFSPLGNETQPSAPPPASAEFLHAALGAELREWLRSAEAHDYNFVFTYLPNPESVRAPSPELEKILAEFSSHPRFRFMDLTRAFQAYEQKHGARSLCVLPNDCHPSEEAHALIAAELGAELRRKRVKGSRLSQLSLEAR